MNNHLDNGTVLPHGLLGVNTQDSVMAFNRAYKNSPLRMGIVTKSYAYNDPNNYTKLTTEYDVTVLEQNENVSFTNIVYRNCVSAEGMGSIADFFEKNLRYQTQNGNPTGEVNTSGQNGAIVILLCLDAYTQKAVIIGGLTHPDRQTQLSNSQPQLYGEYNGINISIKPDGSGTLIVQGATDNNGEIVNPQGSITINAQPNGQLNITCTGPANIIAQGVTTVDGSTIKLGVNAVQSVIRGNDFAQIYDAHTHVDSFGYPTQPPDQPMDSSLSTHTYTE